MGESVEFVCEVENVETISWRRVDGRVLPRNSYLNGGSLLIDETDEDAAGEYECSVEENGHVTPISRAELTINRLPKITFHPSMPITVKPGQNIRVFCNVTGDQPIRVQWHNENYRPLPQ